MTIASTMILWHFARRYCAGELGNAGELSDGYLVAEADLRGYALGCINWLGMARVSAHLVAEVTSY